MPLSKLVPFVQKIKDFGNQKIPKIKINYIRRITWFLFYIFISAVYIALFIGSFVLVNVSYYFYSIFIFPHIESFTCEYLIECKKTEKNTEQIDTREIHYSNNNCQDDARGTSFVINENDKDDARGGSFVINENEHNYNTNIYTILPLVKFGIYPKLSANFKIPLKFEKQENENFYTYNEKIDSSTDRNSFSLFFKKGYSSLNLSDDINAKEISIINKYINENITDKHIYGIVLSGSSSKEKIINPNDRFGNNYELSKARSESAKELIINLLYSSGKSDKNIYFYSFGNSNQKSSRINTKERRVDVTIYQLNKY